MAEALELIARLARRGEDDLRLAARAARGEELSPEEEQSLVRAGVMRSKRRRSRLAPALLAPLLALDEALQRSSRKLIAELRSLLARSKSRGQREVVLAALEEELRRQREELRAGAPADADLAALLEEVRESVSRLDASEADPAQATRVAALAAELVEIVARSITPRRRRRRNADPLSAVSAADLARAAAGMACALPRPLRLPAPEALADALRGPTLPVASRAAPPAPDDERRCEQEVVALAASPAPLEDLYAGQDLRRALARHAALAQLGSEFLARSGWRPLAAERPGPEPLAASSKIEAVAAAGAAAPQQPEAQESEPALVAG